MPVQVQWGEGAGEPVRQYMFHAWYSPAAAVDLLRTSQQIHQRPGLGLAFWTAQDALRDEHGVRSGGPVD